MSTLTTAVYDVIAALPGRGCSRQAVAKALPDVDPASVVSAIHRLKDLGVLRSYREFGIGVVYTITPGAMRPTDGRGRLRKREQSTRRLESSHATLRSESIRVAEPHPRDLRDASQSSSLGALTMEPPLVAYG